MPACASPATESPATTATAIGRNSGSTMASAASGYSAPFAQHGGQERRPLPRPRRQVGEHQQDRDQHRQRVEDGDRRPGPRTAEHLAQLDGDHRVASTRSVLGPGRRQHDLLERRPLQRQPGHRDAGGDQPGVHLGRVGAADDDALAVDLGDPAVERRPHPVRRRRVHDGRPGRARSAWRGRPAAPAGRGRARRPASTAARPRPAGGWTGRPSSRSRCRSSSSSRTSVMPCGSRPLVGSSSTSSSGRRSSAPARPSRCRMPRE